MSVDTDVTSFLPLPHLEFQVLVSLAGGPLHGYGIVKEVAARSAGSAPSTGSLYLAVARLAEAGLVEEWDDPATSDGRRRTYRLTVPGQQVADAEARRLADLAHLARRRLAGGPGGEEG